MRFLKSLFISLLIFSASYSQYKVVLTADSHGQNIPPGGTDSLFINQYVSYLRQYFPSVNLINLAIGGTYIQQIMPKWYYLSDSRLNIDTVLSYNPNLVIISQSGNHTVFGKSADSNIYCFNYLADTLKRLGIPFVFTGQAPRQKTFIAPITKTTYYDSSKKINSFFALTIPKYWYDTYPLMMDNIRGMVPWPECLGPDSLHWSNYGSRMYFWALRDSWITDSILTNYKAKAVGFSLLKNGDNVTLSGDYRYNTIYVNGSNNLSSFTNLRIFEAVDETQTEQLNYTFPHVGYKYIQIVVYSKYLSKIITKTINP